MVLVARRVDKLEAAAAEVRAFGQHARVLALDLGADDADAQLEAALGDLDVGVVVYNACVSVVGPFAELSADEKRATLNVNVRGPTLVAHRMLPRLVRRGRGGLVLVSSLSAFQGSAMVGLYAATKAFDIVLGEALWEEHRGRGVDVLVVVAGATSTPNFESVTPAGLRASVMPMTPEAVAREGLDALADGRGPTYVVGRTNRLVHAVLSRLPRRWAVAFISRQTRALYEVKP